MVVACASVGITYGTRSRTAITKLTRVRNLALVHLNLSLTMLLEIVQALTAKYQNRPVMNERASRNAHHANIPDPSSAEAGSSNGPGTLAQADADGS